MTMNKKEKRALSDTQHELELHRAFRLTEPVERDLMPPDSTSELSKGWNFNAYSGRVGKHCSHSVGNGAGWEKTSSQKSMRLFSTKELAIKALRYAVERKVMRQLLDVDQGMEY